MLANGIATEDAFWREAPRHRWLHVATHGFFAPANVQAALSVQSRMDPEARQREGVSVFHVDYLSGLALAEANVGAAGDGDDGILTAAELGVMDLRHVDTVVLSGCETGLGEAHGGEGAFGMQRALQMRWCDIDEQGEAIVELIRYICRGDHPVDVGHLLADEQGPRFQVVGSGKDEFQPDSVMHNPYGRLKIVSMKEIAEGN